MGRYPEGWTEKPIKFADSFSSDSLAESTPANYHFRYVDIGSVSNECGIESYTEMDFGGCPSRARKRVHAGDTIVSTVRTYLKAIALIEDSNDVIVSTGFSVIRPIEHDPAYLRYLCASEHFCQQVNKLAWGIAYPAISESLMGKIKVPVPPKEEQQAIAALLNQKCAAIDATTNTLETQISTLERYRASVIHEAVTRGLDPTAPTKPSSVDWIGNIPQEWEIKPFKHVASVVANLVEPSNYPDLIEIDPENIESGTGRLTDVRTVEEVGAISAKQLFSKGQIIYSKIRPALNKVVIAPEDGLCSADMYPIATQHNVRWLLYVMRSAIFVSQTSLISSRVAMPKINVDQLGALKIPVPLIDEQAAIADYLDARTAAIDAAIATKRKQLDVLKRRRQSLIYEYVTGKRRVGEEG